MTLVSSHLLKALQRSVGARDSSAQLLLQYSTVAVLKRKNRYS